PPHGRGGARECEPGAPHALHDDGHEQGRGHAMTTETILPPASPAESLSRRLGAVGGNMRQYGIFGALIAIVILFQVLTQGKLLQSNNVAALFQQNAYVMILAIGMVMVIVAGHIDLSVGSVVAFVGGIVALAMRDLQLDWPVAILVA